MSADVCAAGILASATIFEVPPDIGEIATPTSPNLASETAALGALESWAPYCLSPWSNSRTKRFFDCACVAAALPILIPVLLIVALAVRVTSRGPVLFLQKRVGRGGHPFTIVKFRTLDARLGSRGADFQFTRIGRTLRRWKLDELPQVINILAGDMSLVGPRPKMREYELENPSCRPGITGAASLVFACEEELLERVPNLGSPEVYRTLVMPAKLSLDTEYMARATFLSDLKLIANTALRRWDRRTLQVMINRVDPPSRQATAHLGSSLPRARRSRPSLPRMGCIASVEGATQV